MCEKSPSGGVKDLSRSNMSTLKILGILRSGKRVKKNRGCPPSQPIVRLLNASAESYEVSPLKAADEVGFEARSAGRVPQGSPFYAEQKSDPTSHSRVSLLNAS